MTEHAEARRVNDLAYVKASIELWARWCYGASGGGAPGSMARLMEDGRSNICPGWVEDVLNNRAHDAYCPKCHGRGRLRLELQSRRRVEYRRCSVCGPDGKFLGDWCWRCHGSRIVEVVLLQVNPAGIRGTRYVGGAAGSDGICVFLDDLIGSWRASDRTIWCHRVVVHEYCRNGRQIDKASALRVSVRFYKYRLSEAYHRVEQMLQQKMPRETHA